MSDQPELHQDWWLQFETPDGQPAGRSIKLRNLTKTEAAEHASVMAQEQNKPDYRLMVARPE